MSDEIGNREGSFRFSDGLQTPNSRPERGKVRIVVKLRFRGAQLPGQFYWAGFEGPRQLRRDPFVHLRCSDCLPPFRSEPLLALVPWTLALAHGR